MPSWLNKKVIVSAVAAVLVVVVIVVIAVVATGTTTPPPVPKLKITAKVTFTVSDAGKIAIGIFGDRFPVTAKNFIALAKGKYEGRTLSYQYIRSTFDRVIEDVDEDYYVRGGNDVDETKIGGNSIYDGGRASTNRYWRKKQDNPDLVWEENMEENDLINCGLRRGWVAMENIEDVANPAYNSRFKIFTADVTWEEGKEESGKDLVFGVVLDSSVLPELKGEEGICGDDRKCGMDVVDSLQSACGDGCSIQNAVVDSDYSREIEKPSDLVLL